jgi:hypothetical protein
MSAPSNFEIADAGRVHALGKVLQHNVVARALSTPPFTRCAVRGAEVIKPLTTNMYIYVHPQQSTASHTRDGTYPEGSAMERRPE